MTTEERLEALERGLSATKRRNKYLLIGLVVLAVAWAFTSTTGTVQAQTNENIVRAEGFELTDSEGAVRAKLEVLDCGPVLSLLDENGTLRAALAVLGGRSSLSLLDENGTWRAGLAVRDSGPSLALFDENGPLRAELAVLNEFGPRLKLYDEDESPIWSAP